MSYCSERKIESDAESVHAQGEVIILKRNSADELSVADELSDVEAYNPANYTLEDLEEIKSLKVVIAGLFLALLPLVAVAFMATDFGKLIFAESIKPKFTAEWIADFLNSRILRSSTEVYYNFVAAALNPGVVLGGFALILFFCTDILERFAIGANLRERSCSTVDGVNEGEGKLPEGNTVNVGNSRLIEPTSLLAIFLVSQAVISVFMALFMLWLGLATHSNEYFDISEKFLSAFTIVLSSIFVVYITYSAIIRIYFGETVVLIAERRKKEEKLLREEYVDRDLVFFFKNHGEAFMSERELFTYVRQIQLAQRVLWKKD